MNLTKIFLITKHLKKKEIYHIKIFLIIEYLYKKNLAV